MLHANSVVINEFDFEKEVFFVLKNLSSSYFRFCQADAQYIFCLLSHS